MRKIEGDLIDLAKKGEFDVIVHGCNCFCNMGAGIAKQIKLEFSKAYDTDLKTKEGDKLKLGTINCTKVKTSNGKLVVVNGYTQYQYWGDEILVDYDALRHVFSEIKKKFPDKRIGYPAIGAGLAGGDWNKISKIINEELAGTEHTFVELKNIIS